MSRPQVRRQRPRPADVVDAAAHAAAGNATSDDKGAFTIKDVPVGQVNITATVTAADGTRQRGTTTQPVEVKENAESKIDAPIKLADAPMGRGGAAPTPPASMPGR